MVFLELRRHSRVTTGDYRLPLVSALVSPIFYSSGEETPEMPPSSPAEGLLFLHGLESNHESSLKSEEEAGLP